ncbi:hypothetical protein B2J88_33855 [Rhodococcus sp. SRB_17]|nr:hypothetical protein [Rhodococcus sp. SRB_17]
MPEGLRVLDKAAREPGIALQFDHADGSIWDCCERHGKILPDARKAQIGGHAAVDSGAVGWAENSRPCLAVRPAAAVPMRVRPVRELRPARLMPGIPVSPRPGAA